MSMRDQHSLPAPQRRARIQRLIEDQRYVGVTDLSERFGVSDVTIRSDLERMAADGEVDRVRGGAVVTQATREHTFAHQLGSHAAEKEAIGRVAAHMLGTSESVFVDSGTTTTSMARALAGRQDLDGAVVVTNSLPVALELEDGIPRLQVIVTGGTLRPLQHSLVDPMSGLFAEQLHVDTTVLGCTGVDLGAGVTNINVPESSVKRTWHAKARRTILLADGSKLGATTLARVCPVRELDTVVTGASAPEDVVVQLREAGVTVIVAE